MGGGAKMSINGSISGSGSGTEKTPFGNLICILLLRQAAAAAAAAAHTPFYPSPFSCVHYRRSDCCCCLRRRITRTNCRVLLFFLFNIFPVFLPLPLSLAVFDVFWRPPLLPIFFPSLSFNGRYYYFFWFFYSPFSSPLYRHSCGSHQCHFELSTNSLDEHYCCAACSLCWLEVQHAVEHAK